ncbi:YbaB/EbfC family nucleoid-associated protein [Mycobacteroides abscessus]|uniref:YbaB/EbfC family DNA-binding protein n=1 Tax=Mycobacteroides abscessus subsp. abscessus TaxID=1185650 RepID=A0AB38D7J8_9MYCO|nr:YbaB/EbfC family nucleoid-associated protein [Mycobacteroides abscessus]CPW83062.1 Uncharacterised protein [Mycobacteroides abscessus]SHT48823.1 Uncharacterised protein [Mycobacteroides abscessus subsp. abscessus]SHT61686.1 Uncharacterised protein [Mycobacteroides abscessus subsp. abscessus]SHX21054.1 Uncharacterised protein [Mycobacteroides abscessus subsp. abscessus]SIB99473.1 Uncharacterised protein [Mycobacteroides abscessus subsp. abscessus]
MSESGVEEFGRKVQRVQFELEQIRGTGVSGRIKVEVDAAGHLISVRSPDGEAILEAYRQALAEAESKARESAREVLNDPLATSVRGLFEANNAQLEAARREKDEKEARAWEEHRHNPLGWNR